MIFGYGRVSSTEQAFTDRGSLQTQEDAFKAFVTLKGVDKFDTQYFCDPGVSGSVFLRRRPAGGELWKAVQPGDTVFCMKLDRMFRSTADALEISHDWGKKGIHLVLANMGMEPVNTGNGIATFQLTVLSAVATLERTTIKERVMEGKAAKHLKGGHIGGEAPYGWQIVGRGRDARLEEVPEEQKVIKLIMAEKQSMGSAFANRMMRDRLTEMGIANRAGKDFATYQVMRIIQKQKALAS